MQIRHDSSQHILPPFLFQLGGQILKARCELGLVQFAPRTHSVRGLAGRDPPQAAVRVMAPDRDGIWTLSISLVSPSHAAASKRAGRSRV